MIRFFPLTLLFILFALLPTQAFAIIDGAPDTSNLYPEVGMLMATTPSSPVNARPICSGTLISPTVFLTAGHCVALPAGYTVQGVSFDSVFTPAFNLHVGTAFADPLFGKSASDYHDTAVVVLDNPILSITPATLPTENYAAKRDLRGVKFDSVGYGTSTRDKPGYSACCTGSGTRLIGVGTFQTLRQASLVISGNPSKGNENTCYGDSGGPNFLGGTHLVMGITSTGDAPCRNTNVTHRTDIATTRTFLANFVSLP